MARPSSRTLLAVAAAAAAAVLVSAAPPGDAPAGEQQQHARLTVSVDACSVGQLLAVPGDPGDVATSVLEVKGAEGALVRSLKLLQGGVLSNGLLAPVSYAWSDVALTFYSEDMTRLDDLLLEASNSSDRALGRLRARSSSNSTAAAFLHLLGYQGDASDIGTSMLVWLVDPFGVFRSTASELYSQVVDPVASGARDAADAAGVGHLMDVVDVAQALANAQQSVAAAVKGRAAGSSVTNAGQAGKAGGSKGKASGSGASAIAGPSAPAGVKPPKGIAQGVYAPHLTTNPYATTFVAFKAGTATRAGKKAKAGDNSTAPTASTVPRRPAYVLCEVNPLALRFPATLAAGMALGQAASNPALGTGLLYSSVAVLGFTFALFLVLQLLYKNRNNKAAVLGAFGATVAGYFGQASGLRSLLVGTPLEPIADYWPWLVLAFVVGVTLTTVMCAARMRLEDSPMATRLLSWILRALSVALILRAFQHPVIGWTAAICIHLAGPISAVLERVEDVANWLLSFAFGMCGVSLPRLALVRTLRDLCGCSRHKEEEAAGAAAAEQSNGGASSGLGGSGVFAGGASGLSTSGSRFQISEPPKSSPVPVVPVPIQAVPANAIYGAPMAVPVSMAGLGSSGVGLNSSHGPGAGHVTSFGGGGGGLSPDQGAGAGGAGARMDRVPGVRRRRGSAAGIAQGVRGGAGAGAGGADGEDEDGQQLPSRGARRLSDAPLDYYTAQDGSVFVKTPDGVFHALQRLPVGSPVGQMSSSGLGNSGLGGSGSYGLPAAAHIRKRSGSVGAPAGGRTGVAAPAAGRQAQVEALDSDEEDEMEGSGEGLTLDHLQIGGGPRYYRNHGAEAPGRR